MLRLAIVFLVIALIAAVIGFGGVATLTWEGAKMVFVISLSLAALSFLWYAFRKQPFSGLRETRFPAHRPEEWDRTRTAVRPGNPAIGSVEAAHRDPLDP